MFRIRLKSLREAAGLSQAKLATKLGVSQSTVGGWESGKREPNFNTTIRIADYFGVSVDYLLGRTDDPLFAQDIEVSGQRIRTYGPKKEALPSEEREVIRDAIFEAVPAEPGVAKTADIRSYIRQIVREELDRSGDSGNSR